MENAYFEVANDDVNVQIVDINEWKRRHFDDEINLSLSLDMTSLGTLILLDKSINQMSGQYSHEDENDMHLQRLSLAHERLHSIPKLLLEHLAPTVKILDLSHNEFDKLDFIEDFPELTSLICDHNNITGECYLPFLPNLELLWMNNCKILDIYRWTYKLRSSCPNLKYLSLMGNPGIPFYLAKGNYTEKLRYRLFVLSLFPKLLHLDDKPVSKEERIKSQKVYQKHIMDILSNKVQKNLPEYLRRVSQKMSVRHAAEKQANSKYKNLIV